MPVSTSQVRHTPTRHRACQHRPVRWGRCRVVRQPAHQPFPALIFMVPFAARFCWMAGWLRPSPDPYGPCETNLPCMSSHPVEAGAAGAAGARALGGTCVAADWGSLSQCDNIGWQCILQSVPSAVCAVVCCIWHGAADGEFSFCSSGIIPQWANEAHPHQRAAGLCCQAGPHTPPW